MSVALTELTPREGKVLRYIVSRGADPVLPARVINSIDWSDLPHTLLQALVTFRKLRALGLVEPAGKGYVALPAGRQLIATANQQGFWRS